VFNVRSVDFVWLILTVNSQTELAINTHVVVSNIHHDVANTHTLVSDIHRNIVKGQEGTNTKHQAVGDTRALQHHRINAYRLPDSK